MLYNGYEMQRSFLAGASAIANMGAEWLQNPINPFSYNGLAPVWASGLEVFAHASAPRGKPEFGFSSVVVDGKTVAVVRGRNGALFSMEYFGCCALVRHGPICLIAIHRMKPVTDGSSNGYARAS